MVDFYVVFYREHKWYATIHTFIYGILKKDIIYKSCCIYYNNKVFDININNNSNMYDNTIKLDSKYTKTYKFNIDTKLFESVIKKYSNVKYIEYYEYKQKVDLKQSVLCYHNNISLLYSILYELRILKNPTIMCNINNLEKLVSINNKIINR